MSVLGELNELLNKIPVWKELVGLPARVRALEERITALEGKGRRGSQPPCPLCGSGMLATSKVEADPLFGGFGMQLHTLVCDNADCSHTETRQFDPGAKG